MIGEKQIHYYDSINGRGLQFLNGMLQWIIDEASDKKGLKVNPGEWTLVSQEGYVPQQENGVDCGMFIIMMTTCCQTNFR
jgi:Ulp1 family protease